MTFCGEKKVRIAFFDSFGDQTSHIYPRTKIVRSEESRHIARFEARSASNIRELATNLRQLVEKLEDSRDVWRDSSDRLKMRLFRTRIDAGRFEHP